MDVIDADAAADAVVVLVVGVIIIAFTIIVVNLFILFYFMLLKFDEIIFSFLFIALRIE